MKIEANGHIKGTDFTLQEFIPRSIYNQYVNNSIWFLDSRLIPCMQHIRDFFGVAITVNTWHYGHMRQNLHYRGYRTPYSTVGARYSQHKFGRACDFNVKGMSSEDVALNILSNKDEFMRYGVTTIENPDKTPTWTHIDMRSRLEDHIVTVNP